MIDFAQGRDLSVRFLDDAALIRAFELILKHADHPMDHADPSLVDLAQTLKLRKNLTIDRPGFLTYRIKHAHQHWRSS